MVFNIQADIIIAHPNLGGNYIPPILRQNDCRLTLFATGLIQGLNQNRIKLQIFDKLFQIMYRKGLSACLLILFLHGKYLPMCGEMAFQPAYVIKFSTKIPHQAA